MNPLEEQMFFSSDHLDLDDSIYTIEICNKFYNVFLLFLVEHLFVLHIIVVEHCAYTKNVAFPI